MYKILYHINFESWFNNSVPLKLILEIMKNNQKKHF